MSGTIRIDARKRTPGYRSVDVVPLTADLERLADGSLIVRSRHELGPYPRSLTDRFVYWARERPNRTFLAERDGSDAWRTITYSAALDAVRRIAQGLLDRGLTSDRPIAILSENGIDHALLGLAAMYAGIPFAPISPPYSLIAADFEKLTAIFDVLQPSLVYAASGERFARAIAAVVGSDIRLVVSAHPPADRAAERFADLLVSEASDALDAAHDRIDPDAACKILFTSGSTGHPKGVINTHRMMCSNLQMHNDVFPFMAHEPPVMVDWLPWHHTAGGNSTFGVVLYNGGTLYIDDGKPVPGYMARSIHNLRRIAPTMYFNVPKGYEELIAAMRADHGLRDEFFSRMRMMWYAGAAMSIPTWRALDEQAAEACGERVFLTTGLGATETAPAVFFATWFTDVPGNLGLPLPGITVKLVPDGEKFEACIRGPNVTPGYWRDDDATRAAFDDEGFFRLGDAVRLIDPQDVNAGLLFDGRLREDFKLATGTRVNVAAVRTRILASLAPLCRDVIVVGADRNWISVLLVPDFAACRAYAELAYDTGATMTVADPRVCETIDRALIALAQTATGSAARVERAVLLADPPSLESGEMTDKGSINVRNVLARRARAIDALYAQPPTSNGPARFSILRVL